MKKILFVMRYPLADDYNLKSKFMGQMRACVNLGYDVSYIGYDAENYYLCSMNRNSKKIVGKTHFHSIRKYRNTIAFFDFYSALFSVLNYESFDYIYMRDKLVTSKAIAALKVHKNNGGRLIVEIPSYGVSEASLGLIRDVAKRLLSKRKRQLEQMVDLYTLIGNDCPSEYYGKPAMEIVNGVTLDMIPEKKPVDLCSEIHMVAVASMRDWHGFDRVIRGMGCYSGESRLVLHLVGPDCDGSAHRWIELAEQIGVSKNVIYHGPLYEENLSKVYDDCHLAVGSMAFHRIGTSIGSSLKVREYIARGIPFIYSYADSSLSGTEWFALRFPFDDSAVDFDQVVSWIQDLYSRDNVNKEIRNFAANHLSWEAQLEPVFLWFD